MSRFFAVLCILLGANGVSGSACLGQATAPAGSAQAAAVRTPGPAEVRLLQALRGNPTTAPYPFATEPRGSKVVLHGRVGAKIVHDVAVRMAIDLNVPIEDDITIDTAFRPAGGGGGFGTVPGPGPNSSGGVGFGGPPAFGNYGIGFGGGAFGGPGGGLGPYAGYGGGPGSSIPPVLGFPSAGSYGGAPSLLPPPIFGRYDDPFYGFDPPAVVYPPWWGALNAQRVQANAGFNAPVGGVAAGMGNGGTPAIGQGRGPAPGADPTGATAGGSGGVGTHGGGSPGGGTETDIGLIPDGTIDMAIDGSGVATIRGGVPSQAERLAIAQRVAQIAGVSQVVNLLTIKPALGRINELNAPPPTPVPADAVPNGAAAAPPIVSSPINPNTPRAPSQAADGSSDANLTERASKGLADRAATIGGPVRVKVRDGVAQLSGKVPSVYEAMLAYRSVQQTPGVRGVDDRLEFPVPDGSNGSNPLIEKARPDDVEPYLEAQIRRQVGDIAHIDRVRLQADALDLRGTLGRAEDRDRFDAILRSMPILRGFQIHSDMPIASP